MKPLKELVALLKSKGDRLKKSVNMSDSNFKVMLIQESSSLVTYVDLEGWLIIGVFDNGA